MNILCITHADFETPGVIEDWAKQHGYGFKVCRPHQDTRGNGSAVKTDWNV